MRKTFFAAAGLLWVLWSSVGLSMQSAQAAIKRVDQYESSDIAIYPHEDLASHPMRLAITAFMIAQSARIALGVEVVPPIAVPRDPRVHRARGPAILLTGLPVSDAFDQLAKAAPGYTWKETSHGVINLRSTQTSHVLDRVVPHFELKNADVLESVVAVHKIFNSAYTISGSFTSISGGTAQAAREIEQRRAEDYSRRITVVLRHARVEDILNEIVASHGGMSWELSYREGPAVYQNCVIRIRGFGGWATAAPARQRTVQP